MAGRAVAAAAWAAVIAVAAGFHPALREGAPLAGLGRQIAEDAAQGGAFLARLGLEGSSAPLAFWLLELSLIYIAGWALFALCPRRVDRDRSVSPFLLAAALAGQAAACLARTPTAFTLISTGVVAFAWRPAPPVSGPKGRLVAASAVGLLLVVLASPLDAGLGTLTGAGFLPEAWFPLYVEFDSGGWMAGAAVAVVIAAACAALGFARAGWIGLAPACVLVLGPSNPAKGLAAAAAVSLLARAGAPPLWRAAFLAATVALFTLVAFRVF